MNIAIMGAGLSGLACAITLEKNGVQPTIFEKRSKVGDRFVNGEVLLSIFTRPVHDCIASLSEQFGIYLQPVSNIQQMVIMSKNEKAIIEAQLGFTNIRGREEDSFEAQLSRQVKSPIRFHSEETYEQLLANYTHVVLATGDGEYAKKTRNFREDLTVSIKGATVEGTFDRYAVMSWIDYDMAPFGYGYLIPLSEKEANIVIAIPDIPSTRGVELEHLWGPFHQKVQSELSQPLPITDQFQISKYPMGICRSARIGNTFYAGNCFGSMMPFMGFGQYIALLTGVYAAYDLCGLGSYEELTAPLRQSYENSLVLRRAMEQMDNPDVDRIVRMLQGYLGEKLFQTKRLNPLKLASYIMRPYVKYKQGVTT
ncbi:NAD(P)/FAD-dependent oxidoreductase [Paenibacillus chartarius]|uniref:NAD(P)/FAD-dependent oxidoreductase n=1 Tax=Paenibacillus chartarius TaxID=747481 RepID=A0ABV6DRZ8_9BACL